MTLHSPQYITDTDLLALRAAEIARALRATSGRLRACGACSDALADLREAAAELNDLMRDVAAIVEVNE